MYNTQQINLTVQIQSGLVLKSKFSKKKSIQDIRFIKITSLKLIHYFIHRALHKILNNKKASEYESN
jgi:hypothetical protein